MRTKLVSVLVLVILGLNANCQIYSKAAVYVYKYSILSKNKSITGKLYLGCLGKPWSDKIHKQMAIIWTTELKELSQRIYNTGIIENNERIWMHPPRNGVFSVLEYSPFPEIRFPANLKRKWSMSLALGKHWENKEYGIAADDTLRYTYEVKDKKLVAPIFSSNKIECFQIYAESTNLKCTTSFTGFFDSKFGFIQMIFRNIDNTIIELDLMSIDDWSQYTSGNLLFHIPEIPKNGTY